MSIYSEVNPRYARELVAHVGHHIEVYLYPDGETTIDCVDCAEVLIDFFAVAPEPQ